MRRANARGWVATLVTTLAVAASSTASPAIAQTSDVDASDRFFEKGLAFAEAGRLDLACPLFEASYRLDRTLGSLLYVAACHEHEGRLATAWALFSDARKQAIDTGQPERQRAAEARILALEPRLPRVRMAAPADAADRGWVLRLDGALVPLPSGEPARPMDSGEHRIEIEAPGFEPSRKVFVLRDGEQLSLSLGPLVPLAPEAETHGRRGSPWTGAHTAAVVVTGAGVVALAVGVGFGFDAVSRFEDVEDHCSTTSTPWRCDSAGLSAASDTRSSGAISTVASTLGGAAIAAGIVTWVLAERATSAPSAESALAQGPGDLGLALRRTF